MEESQLHIPEGWEIVNFGYQNLFKILGSGIKFFEGEKEYYSTSSIEGVNLIFSEGQVTFRNRPSRANMQPIINSIWFAKMKNTLKIFYPQNYDFENVIISTGFCGIFSDKVELDFVKQILLSKNFNSQKNQLAEGSTQEAVNNFKVKQINFYLPKSTTEQQSIANILSKVDEAIANTEALIAKYTRIKTGLMQDLLTKGIDQNGNIRTEQTHKFKDSPLGRIPKEWEYILIDDLANLKSGGTPSRQNFSFWNGDIPWVKTGEVNYNLIKETEEYITEKGLKMSSAVLFPKGTILMALYGQGKTRGRVSILDIDATTNQACVAFLNLKKVTTNFLYITLTNEYEKLRDLSNDGAQKNLSSSLLKKYFLKIPSDIKEQERIDELFLRIDNSIIKEQYSLSKLQSLKTGLMQDLLSGKVRVKVSETGFTGLEDKQDYTDKKSLKSSNQANPDTDKNQANPKIKKS